MIVDKETGLVKKHHSKGTIAVFKSKEMAEKHAFRYGARNDNYRIVEYKPVEVIK
ncbi:hypothetical protein NY10_421 [Carnobacterium antarcticum]|nr:hypothetical protein NY10_421 [Carnobacterium sp. CP1]